MKKSIKKRWTAALRSGDYEQGRKRLKTTDGKFCCLGVLVDITHPEWWDLPDPRDTCFSVHVPGGPRGLHTAIPPNVLGDEVGLMGMNVANGDNSKTMVGLAHLNDAGWTFHQIADYIEENL